MTGWDLQHLYFVFQHTSWVLTKGTVTSHLENMAQFSQAFRLLVLLSVGFSIGCTIGYKNVLLWTLSWSCIFVFSWCLHGDVIASKAASRLHFMYEPLVLIIPLCFFCRWWCQWCQYDPGGWHRCGNIRPRRHAGSVYRDSCKWHQIPF